MVTGVLRVVYSFGPSKRFGSGTSNFWGLLPGFWAAIHVDTAIICACLPTLKPLFSRLGSCANRRHPHSQLLPQASPKMSPRDGGTRFSVSDRLLSRHGTNAIELSPVGRVSPTHQPPEPNSPFLEALPFEEAHRTNRDRTFMDQA